MSPKPVGTLFDAIGGATVVPALVEDLYQRVLADPLVAPFFAGVSIHSVMEHQAAFLSHVLDANVSYAGRTMHEAHGGLSVGDAHFDRVVQHLTEALRGLGVAEPLVAGAIERLAPLRAEIVSVRVDPSGE